MPGFALTDGTSCIGEGEYTVCLQLATGVGVGGGGGGGVQTQILHGTQTLYELRHYMGLY